LVTSYDLRPGNEGLFWFLHFINSSLTYLDTYLKPGDPHGAWNNATVENKAPQTKVTPVPVIIHKHVNYRSCMLQRNTVVKVGWGTKRT